MKLNRANILLILLGISLAILAIHNILTYEGWSRYRYTATTIAPATYPVSVGECVFLTSDEHDYVGIGVEAVNSLTTKWTGNGDTLELGQKNRLPEKLIISYFSFREKQFYRSTFNLPTAKIEQIFKQFIRNQNSEKRHRNSEDDKELKFVIGIANNGEILVWLRGIYLEKLIFRGKAKASIPTRMDMFDDTATSVSEYIDRSFPNLSDSIKLVYKKGFDAPANYGDSATHYIDNNTKRWERQRKKADDAEQ